MKPSIGRIVHFHFESDVILPAIITRIWSDTCVNLKIFGNSSEVINDDYQTSVNQGTESGQWSWPEIIKS